MKIQFIITGWHYNQQEYYDGLHELEKDNENIDVFWSCHKEPPKHIKDRFKWKLFSVFTLACSLQIKIYF